MLGLELVIIAHKEYAMKQLLITTTAAFILVGIAGCKSTPKTETKDKATNSRANENLLEHMGNDAATVGKGIVDGVGAGVDAIGDLFDGDKDKDKDKKDTE
jgi:hypothetical protein